MILVSERDCGRIYLQGTTFAKCTDCGNRILLSPGSRERIKRDGITEMICRQCCDDRLQAGKMRDVQLEAADPEEWRGWRDGTLPTASNS